MSTGSHWAKMPLRWIHEQGLVNFQGRSPQGVRMFSMLDFVRDADDAPLRNESIAALKLYLVLCCQADYRTGLATFTYTDLESLAVMSRAVISRSLTRLEAAQLIKREPQALKSGSKIQILAWDDDYAWGKIPKLWLYDGNRGRMLLLKEFNFSQLSLHALKIYLTLLAFRDRRGIATLSYDRLVHYTGVLRHQVADAITRLYDSRLISFRPGEFQSEYEFDRTNRYLVRGFGTRWPSPDDHQAAAEKANAPGAKLPANKKDIEATLEFVQDGSR